MKTNLLAGPRPLSFAGVSISIEDVRRGLIGAVPAVIASVALLVTSVVQLQVALGAQRHSQALLDAMRATAHYPLEAQDQMRVRAQRVERVAHSLSDLQGAVGRDLAPIVVVTNRIPTGGRVRLKSVELHGNQLNISSAEALDLGATVQFRDRLKKAGLDSTVDTTTKSDAAPLQWTGTVRLPR